MARKVERSVDTGRGYWQEQIAKAQKMYTDFHAGGDRIVDRYRIEKANAAQGNLQDRYNILYSSTETVRPSLYAQTPKVEVQKRHVDRKSPIVTQAVALLEACVTYGLEETDIDDVMENVIEDYTLPGLGLAWVRYDPQFKDETDSDGKPVNDDKGNPHQLLAYEGIAVDYVHWKDALFGPCRFWRELPWGARKVYMNREKAAARFGDEKAGKLQYTDNNNVERERGAIVEDRQAVIWEIWSKTDREVIWYSEGYADGLLDRKPDPLKLKDFWPFPKPLRAISNTRTFVPRPFYSQYQSQAEELDALTQRIRFLTEAINVRGVYDGSQDKLAALLNGKGNKLIAIENWHQFIGEKGINGAIQWVPIDIIVQTLMELYKARDIVKQEIYEITGFSDIVRGQSKASETLGAQQIKQDWASARLRMMQKEVQRFVRDIVRIIAEITSEQFTLETLALYSGFELPELPADYQQQAEAAIQAGQQPPPDPRKVAMDQFKAVVQFLKNERERCAKIGIETDSTILPDEERERKDRLEFLGQIGAFLQQAGPMALQYPEMRGLLMGMMMFTIRTFRASRPLEQEFEKFQDVMSKMPPTPGNGQGDDGAAKAQSAQAVATIRVQGDAAKQEKELQFKAQEADKDRQLEREKLQAQAAADHVQLDIKKTELQIKQAELAIKQAELGLKQRASARDDAELDHDMSLEREGQAHDQALDLETAALDREGQAHDQTLDEAALINPQEGTEAP
jgi:hypothetical protein